MLKLVKYQVQAFRSVHDSGWIDADAVTALIGVNESGKTNLLLPLWKLSPAAGGKITPLQDYPRSEFSRLRAQGGPTVFVRALFESDVQLRSELAALTHLASENFEHVQFDRRFDGKYQITFPDVNLPTTVDGGELEGLLSAARTDLAKDPGNEVASAGMLAAIAAAQKLIVGANSVTAQQVQAVQSKLQEAPNGESEPEELAASWEQLLKDVANVSQHLGLVHPNSQEPARQLALRHIPKFVYYSNYGNLDSEIYLPHVIRNLAREAAGEDLGSKETAKARTLRVLFSFVGLKPEEIMELGQTLKGQVKPTDEQIAAAAEKTKERSVLLQSASTKLTKEFRSWWKQGAYRFRFEADGDHFRIWVSDDLRPDEVELEGRSTGLQWFLSFFLIFLVESQDAHEGAILLLDEPGLSLHPLAQKDLAAFFDSLAETNQLLYTTHSPFLVDPDRLDQVRSVYVDPSGATVASSDLRAGKANSPEFKSVYAVHSALGLSVSEALLQGCTNVIVEGTSDQLYMSAIKTVLIARGKIQPQRELLFLPGGGAKGVAALVPLFAGKGDAPPYVILDSDAQGLQFAQKLREGAIYGGPYASRIMNVGDFTAVEHAEMEDLFPSDVMFDVVGRLYRGETDFKDEAEEGMAVVPQVEKYAQRYGMALSHGWKVELAKAVKHRLIATPEKCPQQTIELWAKIFEPFAKPTPESPALDGRAKARQGSKSRTS
jgi:energy-coupling factor transporter ATP-binding protein EcfA2